MEDVVVFKVYPLEQEVVAGIDMNTLHVSTRTRTDTPDLPVTERQPVAAEDLGHVVHRWADDLEVLDDAVVLVLSPQHIERAVADLNRCGWGT